MPVISGFYGIRSKGIRHKTISPTTSLALAIMALFVLIAGIIPATVLDMARAAVLSF